MEFISKTEFAYNEIKNKIGLGIYDKDNLYTIVEVANEIGISRTPVSGAIKILEAEGFISIYPGVGFRIKELSLAEIRESLLIAGALEIVAMDYIVDNNALSRGERLLLETYVKDSMEAVINQNGEKYVDDADKYHETLYELIDLPQAKEILKENTFLHRCLYLQGVNRFYNESKQLVNDHYKILKALDNKDKLSIRDIIGEHELHCYELLKKVLER